MVLTRDLVMHYRIHVSLRYLFQISKVTAGNDVHDVHVVKLNNAVKYRKPKLDFFQKCSSIILKYG